jgi:translation elongation factor EF-Ts
MDKQFKELVLKLKKETGCSLIQCNNALKNNALDYDKAKTFLIEMLQKDPSFKLHIHQSSRFGKVGADVTLEGDLGVIVSLSCESEACSKSEEFSNLLDNLLIIGLSKEIEFRTITDFLTSEIPESIKVTFRKDAFITNSLTVEDAIRMLSNKSRENIILEEAKRIIPPLGTGEYVRLHVYNHFNGRLACIAGFRADPTKNPDLSSIKDKITSVIGCYNPLVIHEYTLVDSIKNYYAVNGEMEWEKFLDITVLDRIKIPETPVQALNQLDVKEQEGEEGVIKADTKQKLITIDEICRNNKIFITDFYRYEYKYSPEI